MLLHFRSDGLTVLQKCRKYFIQWINSQIPAFSVQIILFSSFSFGNVEKKQ